MEQDRRGRDPVVCRGWVEAGGPAGAEWADRLLQGRAVTVCVPNAERQSLTLSGSLAISKYVPSAVQE